MEFLIQHGALACTIKCNKCGNDINIDKKTLMFRCRKRYYVKNIHKKRVFKQCWYLVVHRMFLAGPQRWNLEDIILR